MRRLLWGVGIIAASLAIGFGAFLYWAYRPVPTFEPYAYMPDRPDYWPTTGWRKSTPESQGMNSETLLDMIAFYEAEAADDPEFYLDSITVIRNGYIVAEVYPNPNFPRDEMHVIHSATKSIISVLVGIAIDQGYIGSVDDKVVDYFTGRDITNLDDRKRSLSIRDLLSMETGLHSRDSFLYAYEGLFELQQSDDWLQFALDLPMAAEPGERFDYSNISTFLLGAVLAKATESDVLAFARETLFEPLGIQNVKWEWNGDGLPIAWARMWLEPDDLAKIGLLCLQQGHWNGQQLVPEEWIRDSLTPWAYPQNVVYILNSDMSENSDASRRIWVAQRFFRPFTDGYGYQWWLDGEGNYTALGTSGQYLTVSPENNLIFVVTGKNSGFSQFKPVKLFYDYVLPAVEAEMLPPNDTASRALSAFANPPSRNPKPLPVPELPAVALEVSGIAYEMEKNPYKTDNVRLTFDAAKPFAELSFTARESWAPDFQVGLDGVPRHTATNDSVFIASGTWSEPDTFVVDVEIVGYTTFDKWEFRFDGDLLTLTEFSITGDYTYQGRASQR